MPAGPMYAMKQMKTLRRESKKLERKESWEEIWLNLIN